MYRHGIVTAMAKCHYFPRHSRTQYTSAPLVGALLSPVNDILPGVSQVAPRLKSLITAKDGKKNPPECPYPGQSQ